MGVRQRTGLGMTAILAIAALVAGCASAEKAGGEIAGKVADKAADKSGEHKAITTDKLEPYECGTITRLHTYGGIFVASQPKPEDFAQAKKGGVKTVINLRHESEITGFNERETVTGLGLGYINLPWEGPDEMTDKLLDESRRLLNTAERPILMHCASANRVGAVWLAWRALDGGLPVDEAAAEARTVGLKSPAYEEKARDYVARNLKK